MVLHLSWVLSHNDSVHIALVLMWLRRVSEREGGGGRVAQRGEKAVGAVSVCHTQLD